MSMKVDSHDIASPNHYQAMCLFGHFWVREGGVEPPHPFGHTDLNRARLPIPPLALAQWLPLERAQG